MVNRNINLKKKGEIFDITESSIDHQHSKKLLLNLIFHLKFQLYPAVKHKFKVNKQ